jgi:isochorismate hydrolase
VSAHVGVLMTAVEAHANDIRVFLAADAVADFSREHHLMALGYAAGRCAVVAPVAELTAQITASADTVRELAAWGAAV